MLLENVPLKMFLSTFNILYSNVFQAQIFCISFQKNQHPFLYFFSWVYHVYNVQHRETNAIPSTQEGNEAVLIKDEISEFWCMKF